MICVLVVFFPNIERCLNLLLDSLFVTVTSIIEPGTLKSTSHFFVLSISEVL
jgi:hypothetical protein